MTTSPTTTTQVIHTAILSGGHQDGFGSHLVGTFTDREDAQNAALAQRDLFTPNDTIEIVITTHYMNVARSY